MRYKIIYDNFKKEQIYKISASSVFTDNKVPKFVIFKFVDVFLTFVEHHILNTRRH